MNCEHCRRRLDEYVEGLLLPLDRASMESHLGSCEHCAREAAELDQLLHAMEELPDVDVPEDFTENIMARLPERLPAQEGLGHLLRWGLVAAASVVAFVAGLSILPEIGGPEVARDTFGPLVASFQLGGAFLAGAAGAMAHLLDALAIELAGTGLLHKMAFSIVLVGANLTLALALHRYRDDWLQRPAALHGNA